MWSRALKPFSCLFQLGRCVHICCGHHLLGGCCHRLGLFDTMCTCNKVINMTWPIQCLYNLFIRLFHIVSWLWWRVRMGWRKLQTPHRSTCSLLGGPLSHRNLRVPLAFVNTALQRLVEKAFWRQPWWRSHVVSNDTARNQQGCLGSFWFQ